MGQKKAKPAFAKKETRGRPAKPMPEPIPDTPENVALACMQGPPKKDWDYMKKDKPEPV